MCVRQSNAGRNAYLLEIAALNGHMKRFRNVDLVGILKVSGNACLIQFKCLLHMRFCGIHFKFI